MSGLTPRPPLDTMTGPAGLFDAMGAISPDLAFAAMVDRFCLEQTALRARLANCLEQADPTQAIIQTGGHNEQN